MVSANTPKSGTPKRGTTAKPAPAEAVHKSGTFDFFITSGTEIPVMASAPTQEPLPFHRIFDAMNPAKQDHGFVPDRFWTAPRSEGGRGADPEVAGRSGYVRTKMRDCFNAWVKKGGGKRDGLYFKMFQRKAGDVAPESWPTDTFEENGWSYWITTSA